MFEEGGALFVTRDGAPGWGSRVGAQYVFRVGISVTRFGA